MLTYLISACEFQIVEDWEINVHHYEAHGDNSSHYVEIVDAVYVNLRRRAQQRDSRNEAKANLFISHLWIEKSLARLILIPRYKRHGNGEGFHVASADEIVRLVCHLL